MTSMFAFGPQISKGFAVTFGVLSNPKRSAARTSLSFLAVLLAKVSFETSMRKVCLCRTRPGIRCHGRNVSVPTYGSPHRNRSVLRYLSPVSGSTTTISFPALSERLPTLRAACMAAPEEMPAKIPSSFAKRRAASTASSSVT